MSKPTAEYCGAGMKSHHDLHAAEEVLDDSDCCLCGAVHWPAGYVSGQRTLAIQQGAV